MGSKRPIKSFKVAKTCIWKNLKKPLFVYGFWASKAAQDSLGRPKKASKRHLKSSKGFKKVDPKMEPILTICWTTFGLLLRHILVLKSAPEGDHKWDHFWNRLRRISGVSRSRFQELYERCGKAIGIGIILSKEEGGTYKRRRPRSSIFRGNRKA